MTKLDLIDTTIQPDPFKPQAGDVYEFGHPFTQRLVVEDAPSVGDFRVRFRIDGGDSSLTSVRAFHLLLAGFRGLRGIGRVVEMTAENAAVWARSKRAERAEEHANPDLAPFANLSVADIAHVAWLCGYGPGDEPMQVFKLAAARAAEWQEIEGATRQIAMANPGSPLKVPAVVSKLIGEHAATVAKAHRADCALEALGWDGEKDPLAWSRTAREPACKALGIPTDSTFTLPEIVADLAAKALEADGRPNVSLWTVQAALTKLAGSPGRGLCAELVAEAIGLMREDVAALPEADPLAYTLHRALQRGVSVGMSWSGKADDEQHAKACAEVDNGGRRTVQQAQEFEQQAVTNLRRALGAKPYTKVDDFEILVDREVRMRSACLEVLDPMSDESTLDLVERLATSLKAMAARLAATERRIADSDNAVQALTSLGWPRDTDPREWASMLARMALQDGRDQAATRESDLRQQLAARDGTHGLSELALLFVEDAVKSALKIRTDCATETEAELERFLRREQHVLDRESDLQDVDLIRQRVATCPYCDAWEWHQADVARLRAEIAMLRDNDEVICPDRTTKAAWMLPKANPSATVPDHLWAVERFGDDADALHGTAMARTKVADLVVTVLVVKSRIVVQKQKWTSEYPDFDAASVSLQDDDPRFSSGMGLGDRAGTWTWRGTTSGTTEWAGEWTPETSVLAAGVIADLGRKDLIRVDGVATEHIHCLVGEPLMLSNADDAGVTSWRWSVVAPQTSDPKRRWSWGKPHFSFTTDVLGDYTVHLHVVREGSEQELTLTVRAS